MLNFKESLKINVIKNRVVIVNCINLNSSYNEKDQVTDHPKKKWLNKKTTPKRGSFFISILTNVKCKLMKLYKMKVNIFAQFYLY